MSNSVCGRVPGRIFSPSVPRLRGGGSEKSSIQNFQKTDSVISTPLLLISNISNCQQNWELSRGVFYKGAPKYIFSSPCKKVGTCCKKHHKLLVRHLKKYLFNVPAKKWEHVNWSSTVHVKWNSISFHWFSHLWESPIVTLWHIWHGFAQSHQYYHQNIRSSIVPLHNWSKSRTILFSGSQLIHYGFSLV